MASRRSKIAVVVTLLALVSGVAWWIRPWRELTPVEARTREAMAEGRLAARRDAPMLPNGGKGAPSATSGKPGTFTPLPPLDTPFAQVYPQLVADANRGSVHAACRLAHELFRCEFLPGRAKHLEEFKAKGPDAAGGKERFDRVTENSGRRIAADQAICEGFVDRDGVPAWQYLFNAAIGGHLPSRARFAIAPPMNPLDFTEALDGWAAYRQYAPQFLRETADAGYPPSVSTYAIASSGQVFMPFPMGVGGVRLAPIDYAVSARYLYALPPPTTESSIRFRTSFENKLAGQLTPDALTRARAEGEAMAANATWKSEMLPKEAWVPGQTLPKGGYECFP